MNLKDFRNRAKLSQKELGDKLGLSDVTISKYEKGEYDPSIETLIKMAKIFNVSVDSLVGNNAKMIDFNALDKTQQFIIDKVTNQLNENQNQLVKGYIDCLIENKK